MNGWKKLIRIFLFPHIAVLIVLLPTATAFLVYSLIFMGTDSPVSIVSYVLATYALTILCCRIPAIIRFVQNFRSQNKYALRLSEDTQLRVNLSLYGSLIWNTAYAVFQLGIGFWHRSFWFFSLAAYYLSLAVMRFWLVQHTRLYKPGEDMINELKKYRACGWVFLGMNLMFTLMVFFMVYWNRTFDHNEITTITMATYTFASFTMAIVGLVRYRKYKSPVYSASKMISLAAASVSIITLESTMLNTFGTAEDAFFRQLMLALTGTVVSIFIVIMAIIMITGSTKELKKIRSINT